MTIRKFGTKRQKEIYDAVEEVGCVASRKGIRAAARKLNIRREHTVDEPDRTD